LRVLACPRPPGRACDAKYVLLALAAACAGARARPQGPREGDAARAPAAEPPVPASSPPPAR